MWSVVRCVRQHAGPQHAGAGACRCRSTSACCATGSVRRQHWPAASRLQHWPAASRLQHPACSTRLQHPPAAPACSTPPAALRLQHRPAAPARSTPPAAPARSTPPAAPRPWHPRRSPDARRAGASRRGIPPRNTAFSSGRMLPRPEMLHSAAICHAVMDPRRSAALRYGDGRCAVQLPTADDDQAQATLDEVVGGSPAVRRGSPAGGRVRVSALGDRSRRRRFHGRTIAGIANKLFG